MLARNTISVRSTGAVSRSRAPLRMVCQAQREPTEAVAKIGLPIAAICTAALLHASMPQDALAAQSSGRVGGRSGFAARKAPAPVSSSSTSSTTVINNTTVVAAPVVAPPVYGGFGFPGFGFSIMPTFVMPVPFFGGLFQFFALLMIASVVFGVVRALTAGNEQKKKDDGWGDL